MKIAFSKIGRNPGDFRYTEGGISFSGVLRRTESHRAELEGKMEGKIHLVCDRCGEAFEETIDLPLNLHLSDRPLPVEEDLDTVEFLDGTIDMAELMESEIASYRTDYHYCPKCSVEDREIDLNF